jgi:hypothetical protein
MARAWARWRRRLLWLAIVPLVLVGPSLLPGRLFLPQTPALYAPLRGEDPEAALAVHQRANFWTGDRILPALTDQIRMRERWLADEGWGWDRTQGLGAPLYGNSMHGPLYPPNLLLLLIPPQQAAGWLALLALFLAGLGVWRFLERMGVGARPAAFAAIAVQAAGFGVANLHLPMKVDAILWLPFCLTALEDFGRGRRGAWFWVLVTAALPLSAGFPQIAFLALASAALYTLLALGPTRRAMGLVGEALPGSMTRGLGLLLAAPLLAAPALWPTWEASRESYRVPKSAAELRTQTLPAVSALGLVAPNLWGRPSDPTLGSQQPAVWWLTPPEDWQKAATASPLEWDAWCGSVLFVLALVGLARGGPRARFPAILVFLAFGFAQGWPVVRWLYHLPGLNAGAPPRALALTWLGFAWLGALGLQALAERRPGARRLAFTCVSALFIGGMLFSHGLDSERFREGMEKRLAERYERPIEEVRLVVPPDAAERAAAQLARTLALAAGLAAAFGLALAIGQLGRPGGVARRLPLILALPLAADMLLIAREHVRPMQLAEGRQLFPESPAVEAVRAAADGGRVLRYDPTPGGPQLVSELARPNLLAHYGIRDVNAYVPFNPRRPVELFEAVDPRTRYLTGIARLPDAALLDHPILDLAGVSAILSTEPIDHPRLELVHRLDPEHAWPGFAVHRRSGALGPVRFAAEARVEPDARTRLATLADRRDHQAFVLLASEPEGGVGSAALGAPDEIRVLRPTDGELIVRVRGARGGWLVWHEALAPGWSATRDGEDVELFSADHAFSALELGQGDTELRWHYRPDARPLPWPHHVSLLALLGLLAGGLLERGRRRPWR